LIENERAYADLLKAAFAHVKVRNPLAVVTSDREAMSYLTYLLKQPEPNCPALILLAILPQLCNHSRMVRWIRQQPLLLDVPCVVFSADDPLDTNRAPHELVCDYYIRKPHDFPQLLALASRVRDRWLNTARV